jgi:hypothetical protein
MQLLFVGDAKNRVCVNNKQSLQELKDDIPHYRGHTHSTGLHTPQEERKTHCTALQMQ